MGFILDFVFGLLVQIFGDASVDRWRRRKTDQFDSSLRVIVGSQDSGMVGIKVT